MACRDEVLDSASELAKLLPSDGFTVEDVVAHPRHRSSSHKESTIRTHVTSRTRINPPGNHTVTYRDLERMGHGTYWLR